MVFPYLKQPAMNGRHLCCLLLIIFSACTPKPFKSKWMSEKAPDYFKARFETTEGSFEIEAYRKWSPYGVDRLYQLIKHKYYTNIPVYRVEADFVVQFGSLDSVTSAFWNGVKIPDEPVIKTNTKGVMAYATYARQTRVADLYINLKDNPKLDTLKYDTVVTGYPGVASVIKGMETLQHFYSYGDSFYKRPPDTVKTYAQYTNYVNRAFPRMARIIKAYIIK